MVGDSWKKIHGEGIVNNNLTKRNHAGETIQGAWRKYHVGIVEEESWEGVMEDESWSYCGAGVMGKGFRRRNPEEASWSGVTREAPGGICSRQSRHTMAMARPTAPFFLPGESCQTFGQFSVVGQGEPTIVVAVSQYIARVHGTHQGGTRRHMQPPITPYHGHGQANCPLFPTW